MADTDTETLPNGTGGLSAAEEEDERLKQRPADIDADVREMERRKRVEALMSSKLFREELERVLDQQMNEGADAPLLQRIKEMVGGRLHTGSMRGPSCVLPINDIRGIEGIGYEKGEKILRCKLAAVYRLVDLFGWTQTGQGGQITARLNTAVEQVLTTPRGLLPHELTASSLVKVDMQGVVQDQGTTNFPVNVAGFSVHASVHAARPDIRCVLHVRSAAALAVSSTRQGLLPLSNEAALLGDVAYHQVPPGVLDNEERDKMVRVLGPTCKLLFLTSNGALCCGETLEEAFYQAKNLVAACEVQLRLASLPLDSLILIDDETRKQIYEASRKPPLEGAKWRVGGEEFEALMRMLDNAGFRTGYIYRHPLIKNDVPKPKSDVEVPPAVSSLGYLLEEEEMYKQGLWKKGQGKTGERTRWLNSPNVYQKVEVLETGTNDPKKITKWVDANNEEWVQDGSPAHSSTPVKIDTLQFVPMKTNPKEFKALQQQIKDNRRADKISAGPQSHILEGVTWDEANKLNQAAEDASHTHTGDHVVLMGAASKGIIQRGYQHNATVYSAPYARNPFDHVTDREIDEYRRTVERRQRTGDYDTDLSESEAISAAQVTSPVSETEEESRDEHRVLRIETKQAPVRSQPEVVLSDVDTTDFLHAERIHAERTKGTIQASNAPVRPRAPTPKLTPNPTLSTNKRTQRNYSRNTNFDSIVKIYDTPESSPLEDKKTGHPKCKVSLNSRLLSSNDSVGADALELYQPGQASSRSSLYSIPSLEWDGRYKSEFTFRTRSLPRQSRKTNKARLFRTNSHAGFINSFIKDPEPPHFHLPRCRSCGASNNSYAWELSRSFVEKRSGESSSTVDNVSQKYIQETTKEFDVVNVIQMELPVYKVADAIKESDSEFVESQEFTEDCYLGDMQTSYSSDNLTVIEKTPAKVDGLREQLEKLSPVDEESKKVYNKVVIQLKEKFDGNHDVHRAEVAVADPEIVNDHLGHKGSEKVMKTDIAKWSSMVVDRSGTEETDIDKIDSMETMHGDYLNFSDDMDFTQAVYESPVKDLVEKDIRDYSVPIHFYYEGYGNENSKRSPRKKREPVMTTILEPILEESKSSYGDESNVTQGNESGKESVKIFGEHCDFKVDVLLNDISETTDHEVITKVTEPLQVPKETTDQVSKCIVEEIIEDIYHRDPDTENESISKNIVNYIFDKVVNVSQLQQELVKSAETTKLTSHILETAYVYNRTPDYIVLEEGSDVTTFYLENVTNTAVETAMEMYLEEAVCTEAEVMEDQESIIDSVYENIFEIFSNDAIRSASIGLSAGKSSSDSVIAYDKFPQGPQIDEPLVQADEGISEFNVTLVETKESNKKNNLAAELELNHNRKELKMFVLQTSENTNPNNTKPQILELKSEMIEPEPYEITNTTGTESNVGQEMSSCKIFESQDTERQNDTTEVNSKVSLSSSREYSLGSTIPEVPSFNTTLEFEKYEAVSEIIGLLLANIDFSECTDIDVVRDVEFLKQGRNIKLFDPNAEENVMQLDDIYDIKFDVSEKDSLNVMNLQNLENCTEKSKLNEKNEEESSEQTEMRLTFTPGIYNITLQLTEKFNEENSEQSFENPLPGNDQETFSIAKIVQHLDKQIIDLNDTEITDSSQTSENETIIEAIIYYIFERTFSLIVNKAKANNGKSTKKVVTVVDVEDILFTAKPLWGLNVVVETSSEPGFQENYASNVFKQPENETNRESSLDKDNHVIEPLKSEKTSENYLIKTETSGLIGNNEVIEMEIVESTEEKDWIGREELNCEENTKVGLDDVEHCFSETAATARLKDKADVSETLKSGEPIDGEMKEHEETTPVIPVVNTNRSHFEITVNIAENIQNFNKETDPTVDTNVSKQEPDHDMMFHEENIQIDDAKDVYIPGKYLESNFDIAVVNVKEANEETEDMLVEKKNLDMASNLARNVEDTSLVVTAQPNHDILAGSSDIIAQIEESLTQKTSNKEIREYSSRITDSRIEILPREPDIDEIVPESVKSVVSSVLDEEVDDQALQKMLKELRNPDNTAVQLRQTEFRAEITLPFSFENMRPVFFNKDEIYDDQRQAFIECAYSILEEILDKITEDNLSDDDSWYTDQETLTHQLNKTFVKYDQSYQELEIYEDVEQNGIMVVQHIVNDIFENSFVANEMSFDDTEEFSGVQKWMDETSVLETHGQNEDMNTAFVEDATDYLNSRFSSPVRGNSKIFDTCDESPIANTSDAISGEDLRILYDKEDLVSESPVVKRTSVISMSQSVHSGGMKYWVSFDEHLAEYQEKSLKGPMKRFSENSMPSFIAINFETPDSSENISRSSWDEQAVKRTGILCESLTDSKNISDANTSLYSMVAKESYHTACASKTDSFKTCESSSTPVEESKTKLTTPEEIPHKVLLYDTSKDHLTARPYRRQYSSWPPFEETLFYRLLSKFRMSESFDPSDLENGDSGS